MIDVNCKIQVYEVDRKETPYGSTTLTMENHSTYNDRVMLRVGEHCYTVTARDLRAAIDNCTKSAK